MSPEIRFARPNEIGQVRAFLAEHWSASHIFVRDEALLSWQHLDAGHARLNFVVACEPGSRTFDALLGFIPTAHFDSGLEAEKDVWGAIWKSTVPGFLGLQLLFFLQESLQLNSYAGIGLSGTARQAYTMLGYRVGEMEHYFLANHRVRQTLAQSADGPSAQIFPDAVLSEISAQDMAALSLPGSVHPAKTARYFFNRYAKHPTYSYRFFLVSDGSVPVAVAAARRVSWGSGAALRIVDWLGDHERDLDYRSGWSSILEEESLEYVDLVCKVREDGFFSRRGFRLKDAATEMVPDYFEPLERRNILLHYVVRTRHPDFVFFKGDADQDRPNTALSGNRSAG